MNLDADALALLPGRVAELVDVVGLAAALKLVEAHGGTHIWAPKRAKPAHWLADLIGMDALGKLCRYYGGTCVEIDRCAVVLRMAEAKAIADGFDGGLSNSQLARRYGTTERTIRRIRRRVRDMKPTPNLDLFNDFL